MLATCSRRLSTSALYMLVLVGVKSALSSMV